MATKKKAAKKATKKYPVKKAAKKAPAKKAAKKAAPKKKKAVKKVKPTTGKLPMDSGTDPVVS
jgi:hypothetical protein